RSPTSAPRSTTCRSSARRRCRRWRRRSSSSTSSRTRPARRSRTSTTRARSARCSRRTWANPPERGHMRILKLALAAAAALTLAAPAAAQSKFRVAWSHYTGWEPWGYAQATGIMKKWASKHGIDVEVVLVNDYVESINLYTAGKFEACAMTNMDALTIPAVGGIDTTALIVGSFSNGNDGIVVKGGNTVKDLKGRSVKLVEFSVSHYLLARALAMNGMTEKDVRTVNTSDADIAAVFASDAKGAAVTWNPPLQQARNAKGAMMVVKSNAPETLRKALAGAWYEAMRVMSGTDKAANDALEAMAKGSGATLA